MNPDPLKPEPSLWKSRTGRVPCPAEGSSGRTDGSICAGSSGWWKQVLHLSAVSLGHRHQYSYNIDMKIPNKTTQNHIYTPLESVALHIVKIVLGFCHRGQLNNIFLWIFSVATRADWGLRSSGEVRSRKSDSWTLTIVTHNSEMCQRSIHCPSPLFPFYLSHIVCCSVSENMNLMRDIIWP